MKTRVPDFRPWDASPDRDGEEQRAKYGINHNQEPDYPVEDIV